MENEILASRDFYIRFCPLFKKYKKDRSQYFKTINKIICDQVKNKDSILDVGCGDGERGIFLSKKLSSRKLTLFDNCPAMIDSIDKNYTKSARLVDISKKQNVKETFDLVLCLNNVLGHIEGSESQIQAIENMKKFLDRDGMLVIDVNNRYNAANYGLLKVIKNIVVDFFNAQNGSFILKKSDKNGEFVTKVHLFNNNEMESLFRKNNLRIIKRFVVDYETGKLKRSTFGGQLLYLVEK